MISSCLQQLYVGSSMIRSLQLTRQDFCHRAVNHNSIASYERPRSFGSHDRSASRSLNERLLCYRVPLHTIAMFLETVACCPVLHCRGVAAHSSTGGARFWYTTYHLEHCLSHRRRFAVPYAKALANDDFEMFQYSRFLVRAITHSLNTHLF
jgi:hypothetical protein